MRIVGSLGLIFALAFALIATTQVFDLQMATGDLVGGPIGNLVRAIAHFWFLLVGLIAAALVLGVFALVKR